MRTSCSVLASVLALALVGAASDVPEAYQIIVRRNVFSPTRLGTPPPPPAAAAEVEPAAPAETVTLIGVAVLAGQATALFAGSTASLSGARHVGESLDTLRLHTVSTEGVSVDTGDQEGTVHLAVGQSLRRSQGQSWQPSAAAAVTAPAPPAPGAVSSPSAAPAADPSDVLKRMLERRKKEMNP